MSGAAMLAAVAAGMAAAEVAAETLEKVAEAAKTKPSKASSTNKLTVNS